MRVLQAVLWENEPRVVVMGNQIASVPGRDDRGPDLPSAKAVGSIRRGGGTNITARSPLPTGGSALASSQAASQTAPG